MRLWFGAGAVALLLGTGAVGAPFHHSTGEWREYNRDWLAACPDTINEDGAHYFDYSCFASTGSAELNTARLPAYKLTLVHNRLTGVVDLAITLAADTPLPDPEHPLMLEFSGTPPLRLQPGVELETRHNTINQFFVADPDLRDRLLALMRDRAAVTLGVPLADGGTNQVRLSLQGVAASLDFMARFARQVTNY